MCEFLCEVLSRCYKISASGKADIFFEYSPHVGKFSVYWYGGLWKNRQGTTNNLVWIAEGLAVNGENIDRTIAKLNSLAELLGVA